ADGHRRRRGDGADGVARDAEGTVAVERQDVCLAIGGDERPGLAGDHRGQLQRLDELPPRRVLVVLLAEVDVVGDVGGLVADDDVAIDGAGVALRGVVAVGDLYRHALADVPRAVGGRERRRGVYGVLRRERLAIGRERRTQLLEDGAVAVRI